MHNKLAGTKEFGRTIRIHDTPLPPQIIHTFIHILSHLLTHYIQTDTRSQQKQQQHGLTDQHNMFPQKWLNLLTTENNLTVNWEG